ncbi:hypothetical protein [Janthinobacterium sp. 17J80-10]|uniref:hypothetical protein n=1 Tax=Janthinobacterium sp. 17J80-10 TaxID=2497863 RepID=UPI0010058C08|nr:hypothetical protein [Janthinobacterium sp. 17J80-10]QAU32933.1 hypothetical protein EKL02_01385 [Janthinobacterium sp. 17J80-10]
MLLPAVAPLADLCFEVLALCFFLVAGFVCLSVSMEDAPVALLSALLPADLSPLSFCMRNSSARCSTAAAFAGSVVLEMLLSELLCA